eukprot:CAMPEP_0179358788 /NCGR_PEP_ID=MMETSP0797-20121207/79112_1 /TAXON_ID=47934 /ORGANISM="Dinophysis acuminata, Strain DAEP01" /LENGTH=593 /DNA_ID=CAMNT_0021074063 /DNA_START=29 /DNA_END=1809 /DNA_ORIENTATION=+
MEDLDNNVTSLTASHDANSRCCYVSPHLKPVRAGRTVQATFDRGSDASTNHTHGTDPGVAVWIGDVTVGSTPTGSFDRLSSAMSSATGGIFSASSPDGASALRTESSRSSAGDLDWKPLFLDEPPDMAPRDTLLPRGMAVTVLGPVLRAPGLDQALLDNPNGAKDRVYWESFFIVFPVFCGYATLFGLQHEVLLKLQGSGDTSRISYDFSSAVSCLYVWNFICRVGHNVFFAGLSPRGRVFLSMVLMMLSTLIVGVLILKLEFHSLYWVVLAYSLGGMSIGSFESNILNCLTPLGHSTKRVAITAIPAGINLVLVGGYFAMGPPCNVPATDIYLATALMIFCGILVMAAKIPKCTPPNPGSTARSRLGTLASDAKQFNRWFPQFWLISLASTIDMMTLAAFAPGVLPYIYDKETVTITTGVVLRTNLYLVLVNAFSMAGSVTGRCVSYRLKYRHPMTYSIFTITGVALILMFVPALVPLGLFLVQAGDGLIYGTICKYIDTSVPKQFNLIAISFWLFVGDIGSIIGSNLIYSIKIREGVCEDGPPQNVHALHGMSVGIVTRPGMGQVIEFKADPALSFLEDLRWDLQVEGDAL